MGEQEINKVKIIKYFIQKIIVSVKIIKKIFMKKKINKISIFQKVVIYAIIASLITVVLESEVLIANKYFRLFFFLNLFFAIFFLIEFCYRFSKEVFFDKKKVSILQFVTSPYNIIDFLAFAPYFLLSNINETFLLRIFRIFRVLKMVKTIESNKAINGVIKAITRKKKEIMFSLIITVFIIFIASIILYLVEGHYNTENFGSIPRAFWWATITLTTIGYGDVYPVTILGKVATVIISICGIGIVAIPTGIIAGSFSANLNKK